ncbi:Nucleoside diphosphate kinase 2, chloroplastic [Glycine max]|nr:Nucleoside diphosphate kinase 2, chloroplastic [Glycine max]|eukprot:XP_025981282.1 nucleoside diphosphate kinase 2, chloroplastic [Glycine max]
MCSRAAGECVRHLWITGVGLCERLQTIGEELSIYAKNLGINLEFSVVEKNLENLKPEDIKVREKEVLVVNSILQLHCMVKESGGALNLVLQMIHGLGILVVLIRSFLSQPQTEMEAVCGSFWVTSFLPRSPKSTLPLFRSTHQHLTAFPSQSHLFLYHPPPYANAKTLRARTSFKPAIFLPHLIASLEQVDQTYIMVKPDGVQRGLVGEIISRFEKKGFKLTGLKLFECSKELVEEHYKDLKQKLFFPKLIDYITSGPVMCMAWEGVGVVASARKLIGATYPLQAEPGTIRGDLAVQTRRNVVHGSDNPENGKHEIAPEVGADNLCEVLMIDDKDNSFSTPSFRIRYARQDVILAIMISFYVSYGRYEGKSSAVILNFELFHTPTLEMRLVNDALSPLLFIN